MTMLYGSVNKTSIALNKNAVSILEDGGSYVVIEVNGRSCNKDVIVRHFDSNRGKEGHVQPKIINAVRFNFKSETFNFSKEWGENPAIVAFDENKRTLKITTPEFEDIFNSLQDAPDQKEKAAILYETGRKRQLTNRRNGGVPRKKVIEAYRGRGIITGSTTAEGFDCIHITPFVAGEKEQIGDLLLDTNYVNRLLDRFILDLDIRNGDVFSTIREPYLESDPTLFQYHKKRLEIPPNLLGGVIIAVERRNNWLKFPLTSDEKCSRLVNEEEETNVNNNAIQTGESYDTGRGDELHPNTE